MMKVSIFSNIFLIMYFLTFSRDICMKNLLDFDFARGSSFSLIRIGDRLLVLSFLIFLCTLRYRKLIAIQFTIASFALRFSSKVHSFSLIFHLFFLPSGDLLLPCYSTASSPSFFDLPTLLDKEEDKPKPPRRWKIKERRQEVIEQ